MRKESASHLFATVIMVGSVGTCGGIDSNIQNREERPPSAQQNLSVMIEHQKAEPAAREAPRKLLENE
jgi:hypothetical protein